MKLQPIKIKSFVVPGSKQTGQETSTGFTYVGGAENLILKTNTKAENE